MTKKIGPEERMQRNLCQHIKLRLRKDVIWFAVPNEGRRSLNYGARLKAMGLHPGVADLVFIPPGFQTCFMELKIHPNKQTKNQVQFENDCLKNGSKYAVCYDIDAAVQQLIDWHVITESKSLIGHNSRRSAV